MPEHLIRCLKLLIFLPRKDRIFGSSKNTAGGRYFFVHLMPVRGLR